MTRLTVDVTLAPYVREAIREISSQFEGQPNDQETREVLREALAYRLQCLTGAPPGMFVITVSTKEKA